MRDAFGFLIFAVATCAFSQDCTRTVPVNVLTYNTYQVLPFQPERLRGSLKGRPVTISHFERIKGNRILLLIDISGSMGDFSQLNDLLDLFLGQIPAGSSVAVGFFNDKTLLSDGFISVPKELIKSLERFRGLEVQGHTALYDAIDQGLRFFQQPNPGDSILLISDGGENESKVQEKALNKALMESGIRVFVILPLTGDSPALQSTTAVPGGPLPPPDSLRISASQIAAEARALSDLVEKSGGAVYPILRSDLRWSHKKWRPRMLDSARKFWLDAVAGGYLISVGVPRDLREPQAWKLSIDKAGDKNLGDGFVIYPRKLMPCSSTDATAR